VLSVLILPGNKYVVLGTKEGSLLLYDLMGNEVVQEVSGDMAHSKEVWELAMHTNP
jgi:WD40 repeat protein